MFRDREELATSTDLGATLTAALQQSAIQLVICSPKAATSHWVNEEILAFKRFGREGLITRSGFACTDELLVHLALLDPVIREVPFILRYDLKAGRSKMDLKLTIVETLKLLRQHRARLRTERGGPK